MSNGNFKIKKGINLDPQTGSTVSAEGDIAYNDTTKKIEAHDGTSADSIVQETKASQGSSRLKNKDLDASNTNVVDPTDTTKKIAFTASGNTTGVTTTIAATSTVNRTISLPNISDTIITRTSTDTGANRIQNKDLSADNVNVVDPTDTTKKLAFTTSGNTTGKTVTIAAAGTNNRTITLPDITDTVVTKTSTDTLQNKTISRANNTLSGYTASGVLIGDGSGNATSEATLAKVRGGTAQDNSSLTFPASGTVQATTPNNHGVIVSGAGASATVIAPNASTAFPLVSGGASADPTWAKLTEAGGGTNQSAYTAGDTLYASATNTLSKLPVGSANQVLTVVSGVPAWQNVSAGNKNYIIYNNFSNNATTGFSLGSMTNALTNGLPVTGTNVPSFGSGASGNLSIATTATNPLSGTYSLNYVSSAATTVGNFLATDPLSLDLEDQAKILSGKFYYQVTTNGLTSTGMSGTSSNNFSVVIWDATNSAFIIPAGCFNLVQSSGVGICQFSFQTPSNMTSFRVLLLNSVATSSATTLMLDDFFCGPQALSFGPAISDATTVTPVLTLSGNATATATWNRIGQLIYFEGTITIGSSLPTGNITMAMPSNITLNAATGGVRGSTAIAGVNVSGATYVGAMRFDSTNNLFNFYGGNGQNFWNATVPFTWANGDVIRFRFICPVVGWSSNTVLSSDSDTRVCVAKYRISANKTTTAQVDYDTQIIDNFAAVTTGASWKFVCPITGYYRVSASSLTTVAAADSLGVFVNGVLKTGICTLNNTNTNGGSAIIQCNAGDTIDLRPAGATSTTFNSATSGSFNQISIERITGPAVVAISETVGCRYSFTGTQSITTATTTILKFDNKHFDTHNSFNITTGIYTIPVTGKYRLSLTMSNPTSVPAWSDFRGTVGFGSATESIFLFRTVIAAGNPNTSAGTTSYSFNAGDPVNFNMLYAATGGPYNFGGDIRFYHMAIERIGN